jgi:hypothetical protein
MRRIQNILLVLWVLLAIVSGLFNRELLTRTEPVKLLFMEFQLPWALWLLIAAGAFPLLMWLLSRAESRRLRRRAGAELQRLKARAFDEHGGDLEQFARRVQERVINGVRDLLSRAPGAASMPDAPKG